MDLCFWFGAQRKGRARPRNVVIALIKERKPPNASVFLLPLVGASSPMMAESSVPVLTAFHCPLYTGDAAKSSFCPS